ncbi:TPA: hypothetical protein DDZ86_00835 [Candidatus Dependentiae bacterium]|nr:MAG: Ubiquitin carboxyl-terminal hydrolase [candidate division TM6 bacterium GW2011_GWF2_43_87]HBL98170.1 hypothetical protein [Candidatus Dependentiae bacterium]
MKKYLGLIFVCIVAVGLISPLEAASLPRIGIPSSERLLPLNGKGAEATDLIGRDSYERLTHWFSGLGDNTKMMITAAALGAVGYAAGIGLIWWLSSSGYQYPFAAPYSPVVPRPSGVPHPLIVNNPPATLPPLIPGSVMRGRAHGPQLPGTVPPIGSQAIGNQGFKIAVKKFVQKILPPLPPYSVSLASGAGPDRPVGLYNFGATCYQNAVLTMLGYLAPLANDLAAQQRANHPQGLDPLAQEFLRLANYFRAGALSPQTVTPSKFSREIVVRVFRGSWGQQDAQDLLRSILSSLESAGVKAHTFTVGGNVHCPLCNQTYNVAAWENSLMAPLLDSGERAIKRLGDSVLAPTQSDTARICGLCNQPGVKTITPFLQTLPEVFFVQLERFKICATRFDSTRPNPDGSVRKITIKQKLMHTFTFSESYDLSVKCAPGVLANGEHAIYDLAAVVVHHGTLARGHYTARVKFKDRAWYEVNDTLVTKMSPQNLQDLLNDNLAGGGRRPTPYILAYVRRHP